MELFDIVDENGIPTGIVKERSLVHQDGDLHRTSHVWIVRDNLKGGWDVLLQKRCQTKDSFPGCYDISSAGHIPAGSDYEESAIRELKEELGLDVQKEELHFCMLRRLSNHNQFYGKDFIDNQVTKVYRLERNDLTIEQLQLQKEEIESVMWMDYEKCLQAVKENSFQHCIFYEELAGINTKK